MLDESLAGQQQLDLHPMGVMIPPSILESVFGEVVGLLLDIRVIRGISHVPCRIYNARD